MSALLFVVAALLVLLVSVAALVVGVVALRRTSADARRKARRSSEVPADLEGLRSEVQALRIEATDALKHLSVVRYDAFGDMGGHLSWSLALLDDGGNGVVLTSIHGRSDARTYAKNIAGWNCEHTLSPEEEEAVKYARSA